MKPLFGADGLIIRQSASCLRTAAMINRMFKALLFEQISTRRLIIRLIEF